MSYSIKEVSKKTNLSIPAIRYYEAEGIFPPVKRDETGNRIFNDDDIEWLNLICCLRSTGMPVRYIKKFVQMCIEGDSTIDKRIEMLLAHEKYVEDQLEILKKYQSAISWKIGYFKDIKNELDKKKQQIMDQNLK